MEDMRRLENRLDVLEQEAKRFRRTAARYRLVSFLLLSVMVGAFCLAAAGPMVSDVIQAHRFEVVDDAGKLVFAASADERGGKLDVWNAEGANVFRASANDAGGDLNIWNNASGTVFAAYAGDAGGEFGLWNDGGKRMLRAATGEHGGELGVNNAAGSRVVSASGGEWVENMAASKLTIATVLLILEISLLVLEG